MPLATAPTQAAGTQFLFEDPATPGTYIEVPKLTKLAPIGNKGEFIDVTPIASRDEEVIPGRRKGDDLEFVGSDVPGNADQAAFLALCDAADPNGVKVRMVTTTGRQADFLLMLKGVTLI